MMTYFESSENLDNLNKENQKLNVSDEEWRLRLTPEQFYVTRQQGTERPHSGEYNQLRNSGVYECVCCGKPLFNAVDQFDAGCGWPSFTQSVDNEAVLERLDTSHGMVRQEVICPHCDAHLGHVFDDGPEPTGMRYCINSVSLKLNLRHETSEASEESD